jgi:hypothetical protein
LIDAQLLQADLAKKALVGGMIQNTRSKVIAGMDLLHGSFLSCFFDLFCFLAQSL